MDQITCVNCDKTGALPVAFCCEQCAEQWFVNRGSDGSSDTSDDEDEEEGVDDDDLDWEDVAPDSPGW